MSTPASAARFSKRWAMLRSSSAERAVNRVLSIMTLEVPPTRDTEAPERAAVSTWAIHGAHRQPMLRTRNQYIFAPTRTQCRHLAS
jgi:hypothetical protein